ncbi:hypothetical protein QCA50_015459 [Cerrena zonata]|uniref:Malate dehydrogenase n=1 Tax=Cerrena zonata TaxID=2478898 RepID=A0AAW0FI46_9APHY
MYSVLATVLFATLALAVPTFKLNGCDVSKANMSLPSGQTLLVAPTDTKPRFISIGVGVQNYSCSTTHTYTSIGAVAELFDISCLSPSQFTQATDMFNDIWEKTPKGVTAEQVIKGLSLVGTPSVLGQHYFVTNPITGSGLSPKWDFTSASLKGKSNAFAVAAKIGNVPASSPSNIDWLSLNVTQGDLAKHIFRVETRGGQPPASCNPDSPPISVKYVSQYWLYGGSF